MVDLPTLDFYYSEGNVDVGYLSLKVETCTEENKLYDEIECASQTEI